MDDYHIQRAVQNYADASGSTSGAHGRTCTECGARLRRGNYATLCAPCDTRLNPYIMPDPPPAGPDQCAWCERPYTAWSQQQRYCSMHCSETSRQTRYKMKRL